jgi:hypothetical protein
MGGEVEEGGEFGVGFFEPDIGAEGLDEGSDLASDGGVEDWFAVVVEDGERDAPCALTADAPVRAAFSGAVDADAAPVREPLDAVDFGEGGGADVVDAEEELGDAAEDDRSFAAPAVRVVVFVVFLAEEHAAFCEETDDRAVGVEDERACEFRDAAIGGETAVVVDWGEETEAVFASGDVVFLAVAWAVWTWPVPVSSVTKSVQMTLEERSRNGCWAREPARASPLSSVAGPVRWKPVLAAKASMSGRTMRSVAERPSSWENSPRT